MLHLHGFTNQWLSKHFLIVCIFFVKCRNQCSGGVCYWKGGCGNWMSWKLIGDKVFEDYSCPGMLVSSGHMTTVCFVFFPCIYKNKLCGIPWNTSSSTPRDLPKAKTKLTLFNLFFSFWTWRGWNGKFSWSSWWVKKW